MKKMCLMAGIFAMMASPFVYGQCPAAQGYRGGYQYSEMRAPYAPGGGADSRMDSRGYGYDSDRRASSQYDAREPFQTPRSRAIDSQGYGYGDSRAPYQAPRADSRGYGYGDSRSSSQYDTRAPFAAPRADSRGYGYGDARSSSQYDSRAPYQAPRADSRSWGSATTDNRAMMSDDQIEDNIRAAINNRNVDVDADNGVVKLSGTVSSQQEKSDIENRVNSISGVKRVDNQLKIDSTKTSTY